MALKTCHEGWSQDTWGSGSRLAIKSPGPGYLIHDPRLPISSLIPALRFCSTATARAGSCSLITFSKPDGRKPFFFLPINVPTCVSKCCSGGCSGAKWINAYVRQIISLRRREVFCTVRVGAEPREEDWLIQPWKTRRVLGERSRSVVQRWRAPSPPAPGRGSSLLHQLQWVTPHLACRTHPPLANHYNAAVSGNLLSHKIPTALQGQCNKIFVNKVLFFFLSAHEVKGFSLHLASFSTERQSGVKHTGNLVCLAG